MSHQSWLVARQRGPWWPAIWAAVIAFTVVVSSGAVLLTARTVGADSEPAPPPATPAPTSDRITNLGATQATPTDSKPASSRLVMIGPRRVLDSRKGDPYPTGAEVNVPLPGVPGDSIAVLLEVSVLNTGRAGSVKLISGDETTPVLRFPGKGVQTSATVVTRLGTDHDLTAKVTGGADLVVTLSGAFRPATTAKAGRIISVPAEQALELVPGRDGNRATIRPGQLTLAGIPRDQVGALLLSFQADVGIHGGTVAVGRSWSHLDQQVFWGATAGTDRTRRGFLIVPLSDRLRLYYHAGTRLTVTVVGLVTSKAAASESAGLSVPVASTALPAVTLPPGGRADIDLPDAGEAKAALVTTAIQPKGGRLRAALGLLDVRAGAVRVNGPERASVTLTPRLLIR
ncbi:MAG TPA: hypothetical protein VLL08_32070 [Kineosporiaceae bacterium]|nr:hypothetical protein [Kineosporiaceae bacterium]